MGTPMFSWDSAQSTQIGCACPCWALCAGKTPLLRQALWAIPPHWPALLLVPFGKPRSGKGRPPPGNGQWRYNTENQCWRRCSRRVGNHTVDRATPSRSSRPLGRCTGARGAGRPGTADRIWSGLTSRPQLVAGFQLQPGMVERVSVGGKTH